MAEVKLARYDVIDYLDTEEDMALYLTRVWKKARMKMTNLDLLLAAGVLFVGIQAIALFIKMSALYGHV